MLEIDSPGGTVYESARIWKKIKRIQEEREILINKNESVKVE